MASLSIIKNLNGFEKGMVGIDISHPLRVVDQLGFKQMAKRLGHPVVPAIPLATHTLYKVAFLEFLGETGACILAGRPDPNE